MKLKAAFIFLGGGCDINRDRTVLSTPNVDLNLIGAPTYEEAEKAAKEMAESGVKAIELCAGFGNEGTARIAKAVAGKATVGSVKFDIHPGLGFKSGDEFF